jgi:hypothetical protein
VRRRYYRCVECMDRYGMCMCEYVITVDVRVKGGELVSDKQSWVELACIKAALEGATGVEGRSDQDGCWTTHPRPTFTK